MLHKEYIGSSSPAVRGHEVVTGKAIYTADVNIPGMLVGKVYYAGLPSANIKQIDIKDAQSIEGVVAVLTHKDIPGENTFKYEDTDQPVLVSERVRFRGDALAIVAAENEFAANAAIKAIKVELEPIKAVYDPAKAIKPDSPRIWPERDNIYKQLEIINGDVSVGFEKADYIIENTYYTPYHEHAFLEPECTTVIPEGNGRLLVYSTTQYPFSDQRQIARTLGIPVEKVRVVTPHIGGAFGGKDEAHVQLFAALLSQATNQPVQIVRSREESIEVHVKRHPFIIRYRSGVTADGKLCAIDVEMIADTGPYANSGSTVIDLAANCVSGPYSVEHARVKAYAVNTNNPACGAFRGFGMPQAHFACERQMDELAKATSMDPLVFRKINGLKKGMKIITGVNVIERGDIVSCLDRAAELSGWEKDPLPGASLKPHQRRGWGVAASLITFLYPRDAKDNAGVTIEIRDDGDVEIRTGAADFGQGAHSALAHITADSLGIELDKIHVKTPDTIASLDAGSSVASRQTFVSGNAVLDATGKLKKVLIDLAEEITGVPHDILELKNSTFFADGEQLPLKISDVVNRAKEESLPLIADGYYEVNFPPGTFDNNSFRSATGAFTFGVQVASVLVDMETGEVKVEDIWNVIDAGKIIHRDGALGQVEGAAVMGFGQAVMEELLVNHGQVINNSLDSYLIPTSMDVPEIHVEILEYPNSQGPYGAKGIGEAAIMVIPAIVNAVSQAIGKPINSIPLSGEKVFQIISGKEY